MIPVAHSLAFNDMKIMLGTIGSVLTGAIWGNHCSPIADFCIMSSMSTTCDHADHVKSQLVYAVTVGSITFFVAVYHAVYSPFIMNGLHWYFVSVVI